MTLATLEADGAAPSRPDRFARLRTHIHRHHVEIVAGVQVGGLAALALGLTLLPPAEVKAPAAAAVHAIHTAISPEALAGPSPAVAVAVDSKRMLQGLLTEAGLRPDFGLRHLSWDQARRLNALMPDARAPLDAARPFAISLDTKNGKEALNCLTQAAYFEAGGNGADAEAAVAQVVLNRVRHPDFPKTVCGVVYQGSEHQTGCQFTFTCDGALNRPKDQTAWTQARKVAARALSGFVVKSVGTSTYYHANYVFPTWAPTLLKTATVGPHIFYRMQGEEGSGSYLTGQYTGGELKLRAAIQHALDAHASKPDEPVVETVSAPKGLQLQAERGQRIHAQYSGGAGSAQASDAKPASVETVKADAAAIAGAEPASTPVAAAETTPAA